jgi:hypothetical protein
VIHSQYLRPRELTHPFAPCFRPLLHRPAYLHVARSGQYVSTKSKNRLKYNRTSYLLTQEVPYFKSMTSILDNAIDREVGVDRTHFV